MKKVFIFLAVVAMIIAPVVGFCQLTKQNYDQLRILKEGIQSKKDIIRQLQEKILYISQLKNEINNLNSVDSIYGLSKNQLERLDNCLLEFQRFSINNPNLEEKLEEERIKKEELETRKESIMMHAATNRETPEEPDYFQGKRLEKGLKLRSLALDVEEKTSRVNFENEVRALTLEKIKGNKNTSPFTLLLVNYSKTNNREFVIVNTITNETNTYAVKPEGVLELYVLPGKYLCDIVDMVNGRSKKNNFANVGINTHIINDKEVNGFFYAPKYF